MQLAGTLRTTAQAARLPGGEALLRALAAERSRLVLFLPVCLGLGDLVYFSLDHEPASWLGAALAAPLLVAALLAWRNWAVRAALLAGFALALGFAAGQIATRRAPPPVALPLKAATIEGTVAGVEALPAGRRVTLSAPVLAPDLPPLPRLLRIRLRDDDPAVIAPGDRLEVRALVRPPSPPATPGGWDLQRDSWFDGIGGFGYALGAATVTPTASRSAVDLVIQHLRQVIAAQAETVLPGAEGAIAATLLTGLSAAIPPADRAAFRESGLSHLLAIAGLHVAAVMGLVFGVTRLLLALSERAALRWPIKQIAALAGLAAGGAYLVLTGMHVPILRSFTMAAVVVLALLSGRRAVSLRGLLLAAAALILLAPAQILGVSFQMSFSAVLALIAGYEALRPVLARLHGEGTPGRRVLHHGVGLALTSLLAGGASAPFAAYHFGQFQLYFVLANMVAVPITALWIMPLGLLALLGMPVGLDAPCFAAMGWGISAVLAIARTVSAWPAATLAVPHMPDWGLAGVAAGITLVGLLRTRLRLLGLAPLLLGLASPWLIRPPDLMISDDGRLIALRAPSGILVDSHGSDRFVQDAWAQYWAGAPRPLGCADDTCVLRARDGGPAALLIRRGDPPAACEQALLVSHEPLHTTCRAIDRFTVWRDGAQAVWLDPAGPVILSDRQVRGDRPWVALGPEHRAVPLLPMAPTE